MTKASLLQHAPVSILYGARLLSGTKGGRMRRLGLDFCQLNLSMCSQALMVRVASTPMTSCQYHPPTNPSFQADLGSHGSRVTCFFFIGVCQAWSSETPEQEEEEEKEEESAQVQIVRDQRGHFGLWLQSKPWQKRPSPCRHWMTPTRTPSPRTLSQATSRATSQYHGLEESGRII